MINSTVFSKDRACQLDLLIRSIEKNAKDVFELKVIYTFSNEEFEKGYEKLIEKYPQIKWVKQSDNFKQDVLMCLDTNLEYSCFGTDDDIMFGKVEEKDIVDAMQDQSVFCFSLRLGENVTYCYSMSCPNKVHEQTYNEKGNVIKFDWKKHYADFFYCLSVDFHVFRTKEISKLSSKIMFNSPNEFEGNLQIFGAHYPKNLMCSYKQSVLVGVPVNIVNNTHPNLNGQKHPISTKLLNDKYLSGEVVDYDKLDFSNIIGAHQEIQIEFKETNIKV